VSAVTPSVPKLEAPGRVTFARVLASEWTKFRSVRSTVWSAAIAILLTLGIPLIGAAVVSSQWRQMDPGSRGDNHPLDIALVGVSIAQLVVAVLGVLVISAEYSTGSIRSTFTAVPKRLPVLAAKLVDYAAASLGVMITAVLISFFATQAIFSGIRPLHLSITDPGIARCVLLSAVYITMVGAFALALGAITRNTAAGIAVFAAIFFVLIPLSHALPASWGDPIRKYLPANAGIQMFQLHHDQYSLSPLAGGLVFAGYCALAIAVAAFLLQRRDV